MSDPEKLMEVPMGSVGGEGYVKEEQEAGREILRMRIKDAQEALEAAMAGEDSELKEARVQAAREALEKAQRDLEAAA